jgi:UDP-glucose 4-epimerase
MDILITGASGFIGKNVLQRLKDKHDVYAPDSKELDLLDQETVQKLIVNSGFDLVIHAATWNATANSTKDTDNVLENNLNMFTNLQSCNAHYTRMFSLGSGAEHNRLNSIPLMKEEFIGTQIPTDQYGLSKHTINRVISKSSNIVNLRLFGVYGPHEDWEIRFISNAICKTLQNLDITIRQDVCFDYLYIDDFLDILELFIAKKELNFREYNICTGKSISLSSLGKIILEQMLSSQNIVIAEEGYGLEYSGNNNRLLDEFRFEFSSHDESVKKLIAHYRNTLSQINKNLLLKDKQY